MDCKSLYNRFGLIIIFALFWPFKSIAEDVFYNNNYPQNMIQQHWSIDSNSCLSEAERNVPRPQPIYGNCCRLLHSLSNQEAIKLGAYILPESCYQSDSSTGSFHMIDNYGNTTYGTYQDDRRSSVSACGGLTELVRIDKAKNAMKYYQNQKEQYALSCLSIKGWHTK